MPKVTQEHIEKRKADILEAAVRVFKKKGFEPATMKDVVEEAGMSRGSVYQYFSSTEEMLEALHQRQTQQFPEQLKNLFSQYDRIWDGLIAYLNGYMVTDADLQEIPFGIVMYEYSVTSWRNERHRQFIMANSKVTIQTMVSFLQKGVDSGEFQPVQPLETIVYFLFNITDGLILHSTIANVNIAHINGQVEGLKIYLKEALGVQDQEKNKPYSKRS